MSADDKDAHKKGRNNDAASAQLRAEIEAKAKEIEAIHEDRVFDAENHVKDATEEYYEEIALEGDQFLRMSGGAEVAEEGGVEKDATSELGTRWASHRPPAQARLRWRRRASAPWSRSSRSSGSARRPARWSTRRASRSSPKPASARRRT